MKIEIINKTRKSLPKVFVKKWTTLVAKELLKRKKISAQNFKKNIVIVFVSPKESKKLNLFYRGKDYSTDVLSFSPVDENSLGELVLCLQVLKRQAKEQELTLQQEMGYMILHGILHLLGHDHEKNKKDAKKMFSLQDSIFKNLNK